MRVKDMVKINRMKYKDKDINMKLQWEDEASTPLPVVDMVDKETIYARGKGNRYYTVWYECDQFIGDVDNLQVSYGSKEYCIKACQDHDDSVG